MFRILSFSVLVGLFVGCALGPDYERPDIPVPPSYREDVDLTKSITNMTWWELYREPALLNLIAAAIENNQDLGIALARIDEARAFLGFTRADFFPSIDLSGTLNRAEFESDRRSGDSSRGYTIAAPLFWELDIWGRIRRSSEAARAELLATEEFYRAASISLVAEVASTYFLLRDLDSRLEISQGTLQSRKESTRIIQARFDQGYVSKLDLHQAQVEEESAAAAVQQFTREVRRAENALSVLTGRLPRQIERGNSLVRFSAFPEIPAGLPSELLTLRPDVMAAEALLHAQTARIGVAQALRFPTLSLTGAFGYESPDLSNFDYSPNRFWSVGGDVLGPLLSANRNVDRVEIERARTQQLALDYERTVLEAFREVEDALVSVRTFRDEYEARKRQVVAGRNAAKLSRARYDAGETSYLEVLDTERSLFRDELAESEALRERFNSLVFLYKALGGGWRTQPQKDSASQTAPTLSSGTP